MEPQKGARVVFGPYVYDMRADLLLKHGLRIKLQPKPRALLRELLLHPGELVTREQLREALWPDGTFVDFDLGLNVAVKKLRDALCDSPDAPVYIETAPGEGYRFVGAVEYEKEPQTAPASGVASGNGQTAEVLSAGASTSPPKRGLLAWPRAWAIFGLAAAVLVAVAASRWHRNDPRPVAVHQLTWGTLDSPVIDAAISPSGKLAAVLDAHGVAVLEIASGATHRLSIPDVRGPSPGSWLGSTPQVSWLPDSSGLLLCGETGIWSASLLGGSSKIHDGIRAPGWSGCGAAMSPDGLHVAFVDGDGIWMMGPHGEGARRIVSKGKGDRLGGPTWSPDSGRIAYSLHRQTTDGVKAMIETCDLDGGSATEIPLERTRLWASHWAWLPDGRIIFQRPEGVPYGYYQNLWQVRVDTHTGKQLGEAERLTDFPDFMIRRISGSVDGKVLFLRTTNIGAILEGDVPDGGQNPGPLREVVKDEARNRPVAWSPDGQSLFILSNRGRTTSLYRITAPETGATAVEVPAIELAQLVNDGSDLVYGIETPKMYSIFRRRFAGGPADLVLQTSVELDYRCATAAPTCVIVDKEGDHLRMSSFDANTSERRDLAKFSLITSPGWSLSPDGARVAVIRLDDPNARRIDILDTSTGKRLQKIDVDVRGVLADIGWPRGNGLFVSALAEDGGCDVFRVDLEGRQRLLWHDSRFLGTMAVSPDGRHVAFMALQTKTNAWIAENF